MEQGYNTKINDAPLSICSEVLSFIYTMLANGRKVNVENVIEHVSKTKAYIINALNLLELSGLITIENKYISIPTNVLKELADDDQIEKYIIQQLVRLEPFIQYCTFLTKGKNSMEASKLVLRIFNITKKPEFIGKVFDRWIKLGNVDITRSDSTKQNYELDNYHNNALKARIFLNDLLKDNFRNINKNTIEDFVEGLVVMKTNPKKALNDFGRGLEDFLRLDLANGTDLSKANGIGQISMILSKNHVIHSKHYAILMSLSAIRTMGDAHGVDKSSDERWKVSERSAYATIILILQLLNSLLAYKKDGSLTL